MKPRKYTFHVGRAKGSERTYTKTEDNLTEGEINLLASNHINEFNKLPGKAKDVVINKFFEFMMRRDINDLQEERTRDNVVSEPEAALSEPHQES